MKKFLTVLTAAVFALSLSTVSFAGNGAATGTAGAGNTGQKVESKEGVKTEKKVKKHGRKHARAAKKVEANVNKTDAAGTKAK